MRICTPYITLLTRLHDLSLRARLVHITSFYLESEMTELGIEIDITYNRHLLKIQMK